MTEGFAGGCLCGAVRYESASKPQLAAHCHCVDCRKSSGTGHCTHLVLAEEALKISGHVKLYDRPADSGNIVSRGFCPDCGSPVYSTNSGLPGMVFVRASSLDDPEVADPQMVVYTSRAASWDKVDPALTAFSGMPPAMPREVSGV